MLEGQIALVSGASRGIGRAIALHLGRQGASVVGTATTQAGADAITQTLKEEGVEGWGAVLDVNQSPSCEALIQAVEARCGTITLLVNNAGITRDNLAVRMKEEDWDAVIETNLKSVFRLSKAVLRGMMKQRNGRIINITSVVGSSGNPGQINYSAAKAGVAGMSRSLARELASRNITVNCVAPGFIDTDMTRAMSEDQRDSLLTQIPAGRLGQAEEVAAAVGFLASPAAAYITGTTLHVNGGLYMD